MSRETEPRGQELLARYKSTYHIPKEYPLSEEMILRHWNREKRLRTALLRSTPSDRWDVFDRSYTELYTELPWLNLAPEAQASASPAVYRLWADIIGPPPKKVYEVGSGKAGLIDYLADLGLTCKATEITRERGAKWASPRANMSWGVSDGVHLGSFEPKGSYDVVISDQVVEHLHPDDLLEHFRGAFDILRGGGRYVFATPHRYAGPSDVSSVFRKDAPMGMHLKEYTYGELTLALQQAGFGRIASVFRLPSGATALGKRLQPRASVAYLAYLRAVERVIGAVPKQESRRKVSRGAKLMLFASGITLVAERP